MLLLHSMLISAIVYNILSEDTRLTRHTTDITIYIYIIYIATSLIKVQYLPIVAIYIIYKGIKTFPLNVEGCRDDIPPKKVTDHRKY